MIVVDASVLIEVLLNTPQGKVIRPRLLDQSDTMHAPHLIDIEVAQAVRRFARVGDIDVQQGRAALTNLADLQLSRYPHGPLMPRIWRLQSNMSAYDASYVALAEALNAPLITRDGRLASAPGHTAQIELI